MAAEENGRVRAAQLVERTGLALVHEGERIMAPAEAAARLVAAPAQIVNYYFPVEIEILGVGTAEAMAERIYDALQRELRALS
jgi:hypothetical protein